MWLSSAAWIHSSYAFTIFNFVILIIHTVILLWSILYTQHSRYCMSVRPERGIPLLLLFLTFLPFSPLLKGFLFRAEGVTRCTDGKAT